MEQDTSLSFNTIFPFCNTSMSMPDLLVFRVHSDSVVAVVKADLKSGMTVSVFHPLSFVLSVCIPALEPKSILVSINSIYTLASLLVAFKQ